MKKVYIFLSFILFSSSNLLAQDNPQKESISETGQAGIYVLPKNVITSWVSFENQTGKAGQGGMANQGHKGHPFDKIKAGETITLLDLKGAGIINRIWMTIDDKSPQMLRSLRIDMFWDDNEKPAVSVPLGDFFGIGLGKKV